MNNMPVGIGIIGTGFGAYVQLPGFLGLPEAKVIGIVSRDPQKSADITKVHDLPRTFTSPQELIDCPDVQLVSIASPQSTHEEYVRAATAAGKHILCEKPFTLSAESGQKVLDEARAAGIVHAIDFEFRELPALRLLHETIMNGDIGKIESAHLSWRVGTWAKADRPWSWHCDESQGGGVLSALGVHLFDVAEWLAGPMKELEATIGTKITERPDATGAMKAVTSEDYADIAMKSEGDAPVTLSLSNVDAEGKGLTIEVVGSDATLVLVSNSQTYGTGLTLSEKRGSDRRLLLQEGTAPKGTDPRVPPFQSLAKRLLAAIRNGDTDFRPSFEEGVRTQALREATLASSATQQRLDIALP